MITVDNSRLFVDVIPAKAGIQFYFICFGHLDLFWLFEFV